jgi:hypothetical protein
MFNTTLCLSKPASAKLGRGAGLSGSTHLSINVLGFAEASADLFEVSDIVVFDPATCGLDTRERVGLELLLMMAHLPGGPPPFRCDRQYRNPAHDYSIVSSGTLQRDTIFNTSDQNQCIRGSLDRESSCKHALFEED